LAINENSLYKFHPKKIDPREHMIAVGDTVLYMNQEYKVTTVGARWLHAYKLNENNRQVVLLRKRDVVKVLQQANEKPL
jgi:plastocyanin